jgi:hypothetical protein
VILLLSRLSGYQKAELRSRRLAFAVVDPGGQPDPDVPTVGATNWSFLKERLLSRQRSSKRSTIFGVAVLVST